MASKGIIFCRIQLSDGTELDVYGTHMQAGHSESEQRSRELQTKQLWEFINLHSGKDKGNVLLAGDLNMGPAKHSPPEEDDFKEHSVH